MEREYSLTRPDEDAFKAELMSAIGDDCPVNKRFKTDGAVFNVHAFRRLILMDVELTVLL